MMSYLIENWPLMVLIIAFIVVGISAIFMFFKLPTCGQLKKIKEWLLLAVTEAEKELGSGTGQLKLRYVYDLFLMRFPWISRIISFSFFSSLVDEVLVKMRDMLVTNQSIKQLVVNKEDDQ